MAQSVVCPYCKCQLSHDVHMVDQQVACPGCGGHFTMPALAMAEVPPGDIGGLPQIDTGERTRGKTSKQLTPVRAIASKRREQRIAEWVGVAFVVILFACCGGFLVFGPERSPEEQKESRAQDYAWKTTKDTVLERVKSPSTAEFGGRRVVKLTDNETGDNIYYVAGWVDAQNAFGATVRSEFKTTWACSDEGVFRVLDIETAPR